MLFEALAEEPGCAAGAQRMQSALNVEGSAAAVARKLAAAFTQLFDGIGGSKTVSLYESAHVGVSGRLFQAPSGDMEKLLRQSECIDRRRIPRTVGPSVDRTGVAGMADLS